MHKRLLSLVLTLTLTAALAPALGTGAYAGAPAKVTAAEAEERIDTLTDKLGGKIFTTDQVACADSACDKCDSASVIEAPWFTELIALTPTTYYMRHYCHYANTTLTKGWSCCGFANFAGWYIFAQQKSDAVTYQQVAYGPFTEATMENAMPGDILRLVRDSSGNGGHSAIFISSGSTGITVLDNNYVSSDEIAKHAISYSSSYDYVTISRATNYSLSGHAVIYNANGGAGAMASGSVETGERFTLSDCGFTKAGCSFTGWNVRRDADNKWYVGGKGWYTEAEITAGGYEKQLYENGGSFTLDRSWTEGIDGDSSYTFFAVWGAPANPFTDVAENAYYYAPVLWAVSNGVTSGTSATTFAPDDACTRGQVMSFLWRAEGSPEVFGTSPFADVADSSAYYYTPVLWAVTYGVTSGTTATTFSPDDQVTRGQYITFLWRRAGSPAVTGVANPFTDVSDQYYAQAVLWAVKTGVTAGTSETTFGPEDGCTRAQAVTLLYRYLNG